MSRHSTVSVSSSAPAIGNGHINFDQVPSRPAKRDHRSFSMSGTNPPDLDDTPGASLDPDELFSKHTVSEVKFVQHRLRADADAKQEELRLMVGERYRDLLQASTSIISIARSSKRVKQALEETKDAILSQEEPPMPQRPLLNGGSDTHLHTLQLLSAHMKLLLDAPEHLWRLIERKRYFPAAWLFLLARVVHRALVRDDDRDEGAWSHQGVHVLEQFPLVQRQWDAVSQFRSQITHKAMISLREYTASVEDTCATLLTLHLLDSRPLTETLSVFLIQRSKTLNSMLSWKYEVELNSSNAKPNGNALEKKPHAASSDFRRKSVNEIREATHSALDTISRTVQTAQNIFQGDDSQLSLIRRVLEYIQSDSPTSPEHIETLPAELYLTTQSLLTTLPSSTHFQLLPLDLRSYRPYVDLSSPSSSIQPSQFTQKMDEWFRQSSSVLQKAVERWFCDLQSVKEVWSVRASTRGWISTSGLQKEEITRMTGVLDDICGRRVAQIWKLKLDATLRLFGDQLNSTFESLNESSGGQKKQISPVVFLFQAPPLPVLSQPNIGTIDSSFQKYKNTLRRQIVGRTALLDDVLATLETCARTIQQDLAHVKAGGDETRGLVEQLENTYRPNADILCANVVEKLEVVGKVPIEGSLSTTDGLIFLGRVSDELSSSSPFLTNIGCQSSVAEDFRAKAVALYNQITDRWQKYTVLKIVDEHRLASRPTHHAFTTFSKPSGPSSDLVQSLLSLTNSIQELGVSRNQTRQRSLVQATLYQFITDLTGKGWKENGVQSIYDLAFLWKLATLQGPECDDLPSILEKRIEDNLPTDMNQADLNRSASESLARMQTLLATLLPRHPPSAVTSSADKFSTLLPYGSPPLDQQFQPAIDLAKPSSRFGLLLVGGT